MEPLRPDDIVSREAYEAMRPEFRRRMMALRDLRRVLIGDHASLHFENRDTMRYQVLEMLRAEDSWDRPGAVEEELEAYNPLIPRRGELSATLMFEYETPEERARHLAELKGIERCVWLDIGSTRPLLARFDERQIGDDRISSVQYVKWSLDETQRDLLRTEGTPIRVRIDHPHYRAEAELSEPTRREIMRDID